MFFFFFHSSYHDILSSSRNYESIQLSNRIYIFVLLRKLITHQPYKCTYQRKFVVSSFALTSYCILLSIISCKSISIYMLLWALEQRTSLETLNIYCVCFCYIIIIAGIHLGFRKLGIYIL